jgi:predicted RNA-binding Zn-ribbon protein involved in translation (DUF1610 family)
MTNRELVNELSNVCPVCNTRLRITPQGTTESNFHCPECEADLVARRRSDCTIDIATVPTVASRDRFDLPQFFRRCFRNSRLVAFAVAASIGWAILSLTIPSVETSSRHTHVDDIADADDRSESSDLSARVGSQKSASENGSGMVNSKVADITPVEQSGDLLRVVERSEAEDETGHASQHPANDSTVDAQLVTIQRLAADGPVTPHPDRPKNAKSSMTQGGEAGTNQPEPDAEPIARTQTLAEPMTVRHRLEISIRSFRLTNPLPFREVVRLVEQMCRVRIDASAASPEELAKGVTLSLQETIPIEILSEAARKSGLRVIVDETSVRVVSVDD